MKCVLAKLVIILIAAFSPFTIDAYSHISPYSYCGGDPVNCIDPTGEDVVVLNYTEGEHLAMLIQDKNGKWQYYSVNGDNVYISGSHTGGRPFNDVAIGSWDIPQEFMNSSYNVRDNDSKEDKSKNHFGFEEGYQIPATPQQDEIMRNSFSKIAKTEYNFFNNNCATAVQESMVNAGIPVSEPTMVPSYTPMSTPYGITDVFTGYQMKCNINIHPKSAFQSIIKWNPNGTYIHK